MICSEQMIPLFLEACPEFQLVWKRHVVHTMNGNGSNASRNSVSEVIAQYLISHVKRGYFKEIPAAFAVIEKLLEVGDEETRIRTETGILTPLQLATSRFPRGTAVCQWLGPRTQEVWDVLASQAVEGEITEKENSVENAVPFGDERSVAAALGVIGGRVTEYCDTIKENRDLSMAFGVMGGGPSGLTYWGWGMEENLWSLGVLLLVWLGLSIVEKFQRKQMMGSAQEQENTENASEKVSADRFMVQWIWKLLDRAIGLLLVLGIPIGLSIVMGHKNFLDSSLLDLLMVVVGIVVLVAMMLRDRLWKQVRAQENTPSVPDKSSRDGCNNTVGSTMTQAERDQSIPPDKAA
jgi:hypothetical protein